MIVTKEYLNNMILEETRLVISERQMLLIESQITNIENTQFFAILKEQVGQISDEEVKLLKEFLGGFMEKAKKFMTDSLTAGVKGIKRFIELLLGTIREVFVITGTSGGATTALGVILTQTDWGMNLIRDVMSQLTSLAGTGSEVGEHLVRSVNYIMLALKDAGLKIPGKEIVGFDPESVTAFFTEVLTNAETVVVALQNLDPAALTSIGFVSAASGFVAWLLNSRFKKIGLELKGKGLLSTLKNLMFRKKEIT